MAGTNHDRCATARPSRRDMTRGSHHRPAPWPRSAATASAFGKGPIHPRTAAASARARPCQAEATFSARQKRVPRDACAGVFHPSRAQLEMSCAAGAWTCPASARNGCRPKKRQLQRNVAHLRHRHESAPQKHELAKPTKGAHPVNTPALGSSDSSSRGRDYLPQSEKSSPDVNKGRRLKVGENARPSNQSNLNSAVVCRDLSAA